MDKLREDILANVIVCPKSSCWLWSRAKNSEGYGNKWYEGKCEKAHRLAYRVFVGEIPKGKHVLHSCDVPSCCNPEHLRTGTHSENMQDIATRERAVSVLNWDKVAEIRASYSKGKVTHAELSLKYGVGRQTITRILNNQRWKVEVNNG